MKMDHLAYEVLKHKNGIAEQKADAHAEVPDENKPGVMGRPICSLGIGHSDCKAMTENNSIAERMREYQKIAEGK